MILFDINVLIYAHREDQEHHEFFRTKLEEAIGTGTPFALTPLTAGDFIRIVTQPSFPNGPTPLPQALAVVDSLLSNQSGHLVHPGRRHWELFSQLCRRTGASGKLASDAQHAAIAIEHAATWITRDKDFARFTEHGLKWEHWTPGA